VPHTYSSLKERLVAEVALLESIDAQRRRLREPDANNTMPAVHANLPAKTFAHVEFAMIDQHLRELARAL